MLTSRAASPLLTEASRRSERRARVFTEQRLTAMRRAVAPALLLLFLLLAWVGQAQQQGSQDPPSNQVRVVWITSGHMVFVRG